MKDFTYNSIDFNRIINTEGHLQARINNRISCNVVLIMHASVTTFPRSPNLFPVKVKKVGTLVTFIEVNYDHTIPL